MSKNAAYRNTICGYCGQSTGARGEGEHVLPRCMYPVNALAGQQIRRPKIPSCRTCNQSFQADEAHARNILVSAGLDMTPARNEIWTTAMRGIRRGAAGRREGFDILSQLKDGPILKSDGRPYRKIFPLRDPRVVHVIRKVVRGLYFLTRKEAIADENRVFLQPCGQDRDIGVTFDKILEVPSVFSAHALFTDGELSFNSIWFLSFYSNVHVGAAVLRRVPNASAQK